jgi:hypothetical protein
MNLRFAGMVAVVMVSLACVPGLVRGAGGTSWWVAGEPREFPERLSYPTPTGVITTLNLSGPRNARDEPFFRPLGSNGRACVTCHQPANGMSLAVATIRERWQATSGHDPLFAAIDGSDCPSLPQDQESSHSLLLTRGLFRIARPWPPRDADGKPIRPQFTLEVVRDPTGCNNDPRYGLHSAQSMVSVYRRPRPATNLKYVLAVGFPFEPKTGLPLPRDPETGTQVSGNLMADMRATTLKLQALDALRSHLQFMGQPPPGELARIIAFESALYTAASNDTRAGALDTDGAEGGPEALAAHRGGELQYSKEPVWQEFLAWKDGSLGNTQLSDAQREFRRSVARGADLFANRNFLVRDSAGITNMGFGNPVRNSCAFCHNMQHTGMDVAPGQVDIGIANEPWAMPSDRMPLFKLTCLGSQAPHPHLGRVVYTQDPGFALTTGKCTDIGKITAQSMRGLAARAPYFSDGSAQTLRDVVEYYERRYHIGLSEQEKVDLTNLMSVL